MMVLGFRELAELRRRNTTLLESSEGEPALDAMRVVEQLPILDMRSKSLGLTALDGRPPRQGVQVFWPGRT